jgi:hypothetical protein
MSNQPPRQVDPYEEFWSGYGKTLAQVGACTAIGIALLLVYKPLALIMVPATPFLVVRGMLRAGRTIQPSVAQDWRSDPSVELWGNHPGIALLCTAFALLTGALLIYARLHH